MERSFLLIQEAMDAVVAEGFRECEDLLNSQRELVELAIPCLRLTDRARFNSARITDTPPISIVSH